MMSGMNFVEKIKMNQVVSIGWKKIIIKLTKKISNGVSMGYWFSMDCIIR